MDEGQPTFSSGPQALQWKRLRRLNLVGARLEYLTRVTLFDRFFAATLLRLLPRFISPNRITIFRFISIPFILFLLLSGYNLAGTILFVISALSDALDGALARTKHRITKWGIVADPIADKLLIGSVALLVVGKELGDFKNIGHQTEDKSRQQQRAGAKRQPACKGPALLLSTPQFKHAKAEYEQYPDRRQQRALRKF